MEVDLRVDARNILTLTFTLTFNEELTEDGEDGEEADEDDDGEKNEHQGVQQLVVVRVLLLN
jgi:hypothetical protein